MSFHFPTKNSQILLDFRPNLGEPSLKQGKLNPILEVKIICNAIIKCSMDERQTK